MSHKRKAQDESKNERKKPKPLSKEQRILEINASYAKTLDFVAALQCSMYSGDSEKVKAGTDMIKEIVRTSSYIPHLPAFLTLFRYALKVGISYADLFFSLIPHKKQALSLKLINCFQEIGFNINRRIDRSNEITDLQSYGKKSPTNLFNWAVVDSYTSLVDSFGAIRLNKGILLLGKYKEDLEEVKEYEYNGESEDDVDDEGKPLYEDDYEPYDINVRKAHFKMTFGCSYREIAYEREEPGYKGLKMKDIENIEETFYLDNIKADFDNENEVEYHNLRLRLTWKISRKDGNLFSLTNLVYFEDHMLILIANGLSRDLLVLHKGFSANYAWERAMRYNEKIYLMAYKLFHKRLDIDLMSRVMSFVSFSRQNMPWLYIHL